MSVREKPAAVLRATRSPADPRLAVTYPGPSVSTELVSGGEVLWSGTWQWEIRCDGAPIEPQGQWDETCRYRDADVDYLELQIRCDGGFRVERHILLAREDRFLLLADAVLSRRRAKIEYRGSLPLADRVQFQAAQATCDGRLKGRRARALVVPLALPEWREEKGGAGGEGQGTGALQQTERRLELSLSGERCCLFAPLFIDLNPRRLAKPLTWRQLTVGENLTAQPRDVAVGYRVMIGRKQWLIYRALATKANRTLLGHNLSTEFLVARFRRSGRVEPLLEIE